MDNIEQMQLLEGGIWKLPTRLPSTRSPKNDLNRRPTWKQNLFLLAVATSTVAAGLLISNILFRSKAVLSGSNVVSKPEGAWSVEQWHSLFENQDQNNGAVNTANSPAVSTISPHQEQDHRLSNNYHSYYQDRFPTYNLPYWAKKNIPYDPSIPTTEEVCFVHVGKAGGSTIGCSLGFSLHCSTNDQNIPGSLLAPLTTHAFHRGVYDCTDDAAYYLFVVRDPLARILSAFNYDRPLDNNVTDTKFKKKEFYLDCPFWTLEDVAQKGLMQNKNSNDGKAAEASQECQEIAKQSLKGIGNHLPHWYFNYQYYFEFLPKNAKLLVIRSEHMVQDWNSIEVILSEGRIIEDIVSNVDFPHDNSHNTNEEDLFLSEDSKLALCQALCNEIQVYKTILKRAVNLGEDDIQQSIMKELMESCPKEALDSCNEEKPDINQKIEERKGC